MRSPGSTRGRGCGFRSATARRRATSSARLPTLGYRHIGWDLELFEWEAGCTAAELAARAVDGVRAHGDGAIVLLHTWPDPVAPALSEMVTRLRDEGARFVGVDELDLPAGLEPVAMPRPGDAVAAT